MLELSEFFLDNVNKDIKELLLHLYMCLPSSSDILKLYGRLFIHLFFLSSEYRLRYFSQLCLIIGERHWDCDCLGESRYGLEYEK